MKTRILAILKQSIRILIPFVMLSFTYAFWFVFDIFINNDFHINSFGYNAMDQGLLPFYMFLWLFLVDYIRPIKNWYEDEENQKESFTEALRNTWREGSIFSTFMYRLLINGRGFAYFVLAVNYDVNVVYLELTLIRVVISWIAALLLCLLIPNFIGATLEEKKMTFSPFNIIVKCAGTVAITISLILLKEVY